MANMKNLISLLSSDNLSKDDSVNMINKIQFTGPQLKVDSSREQEMPMLNNGNTNQLKVPCMISFLTY